MRDVLKELSDLLQLERIEQNLFRGQSQDLGWGSVFGGQVLGQALSAAAQTVPKDRRAHSLHGYFLRRGDARKPIVYDVDCIRDGGSFTTRRVVAIQGGKAIFNMSASFQIQEPGFEHQDAMPDVCAPEKLLSQRDLAIQRIDDIPLPFRERATCERPIEVRSVGDYNFLKPKKQEPRRCVWYKTRGELPDDPLLHQYLLVYASDFNLIGSALLPHGVTWLNRGMQVASLDHAMWFHRPFRMDEWLLYAIESPSASGARGLARGRFFDRDGNLVASVMQEGLIRRWPKVK
jgi:acyl-CoA thioesterase II